jgi:hypothetical protein
MKATINRTVEVTQITIAVNGNELAVDRQLKVLYFYPVVAILYPDIQFYTNYTGYVFAFKESDIADWLTALIQSRPEVGSVLDAKYHGLFSEFLNQNIQL